MPQTATQDEKKAASLKPSLSFLQKVANGGVRKVMGYSNRRGGYYRFVGGEETARRYAAAGLIRMPGVVDLGRPALASLTDAGRALLQQGGAPNRKSTALCSAPAD